MDINKYEVQTSHMGCGQDGATSPTQLIRGWSPERPTPLPHPREQLGLRALPQNWHTQATGTFRQQDPLLGSPAYPGQTEEMSQSLFVFKTNTLFLVKSNIRLRKFKHLSIKHKVESQRPHTFFHTQTGNVYIMLYT